MIKNIDWENVVQGHNSIFWNIYEFVKSVHFQISTEFHLCKKVSIGHAFGFKQSF